MIGRIHGLWGQQNPRSWTRTGSTETAARQTPASRRATGAVLVVALVCSVASFATLAWIVPTLNQAFRETVLRQVDLPKGPNELTLSELGQAIKSHTSANLSGGLQMLALSYHQVWALSCSTFVLAVFALSVVTRWRAGRLVLAGVAFGAYLGYYLLLFLGRTYVLGGTLPAFAGAWLPNVVLGLVSAALMTIGSRRSGAGVHLSTP